MAVWNEFASLTPKYKCESLGQGASSIDPPPFLVNAMIETLKAGPNNQYCRSYGQPALVKKIAQTYAARLGRNSIDPMSEVLVTSGANAALSCFVSAYANKGDNVVSFAPMFPMYIDHVEFSGANLLEIPLLPSSDGKWNFEWTKLESSLRDPNTKVFMFNTPHNPTGKVFSVEEI